jgi:pimeloyl-ACP methyl ester carboxylesterase
VPDLRGHGGSTQMRFGSMPKLDSTRVSSDQYYAMPYRDMEALRRFLVEKNDAGKLNLNKLCIVGAEMGGSVAVHYSLYDWTTPRREAERVGPARDVKALVLISPAWAFPGLPLNKPLGNPLIRSRLPMMILVGREDSKALSDARRIHNLLKRFHPDPKEVGPERQDLFFFPLPTKLQGTKMLGVKSLNIEKAIGSFIDVRLVKQSYPWEQRGTKR